MSTMKSRWDRSDVEISRSARDAALSIVRRLTRQKDDATGLRQRTGWTGPMQRGDVWFAATPGGDRPVLVVTRDPLRAAPAPWWSPRSRALVAGSCRSSARCAWCATTRRAARAARSRPV